MMKNSLMMWLDAAPSCKKADAQKKSSLGQNLKTSNFVWEIFFAILICIVGLILFSLLIGNMQNIFSLSQQE
ncbi:hypothetical protein P3S68_031378 [Capsicum galapagoense]